MKRPIIFFGMLLLSMIPEVQLNSQIFEKENIKELKKLQKQVHKDESPHRTSKNYLKTQVNQKLVDESLISKRNGKDQTKKQQKPLIDFKISKSKTGKSSQKKQKTNKIVQKDSQKKNLMNKKLETIPYQQTKKTQQSDKKDLQNKKDKKEQISDKKDQDQVNKNKQKQPKKQQLSKLKQNDKKISKISQNHKNNDNDKVQKKKDIESSSDDSDTQNRKPHSNKNSKINKKQQLNDKKQAEKINSSQDKDNSKNESKNKSQETSKDSKKKDKKAKKQKKSTQIKNRDKKQQNDSKDQDQKLSRKQNGKQSKQQDQQSKNQAKSKKNKSLEQDQTMRNKETSRYKGKTAYKDKHKENNNKGRSQQPASLNPEDFKQLTKKLTIIDTRPSAKDGLIKGAYWFADQQIIKKWIGVVLKKNTQFLLITEKGKQIETITMFKNLGYTNIKGINGFDVKDFSGQKNLPVMKSKGELEPQKCFSLNLKSKKQCKGVVETKQKTRNSLMIPLQELQERVDELKGKENIVINCKDKSEAKVAYSILANKGIYCYVLSQGTQQFSGLGYTIVKY